MLHLTNENIDQVLDGHELVVVDLWAKWCPPCKGYGAVFARVASKLRDVTFAKCDIDANEEFADELGVEGVPTTIVFRAGKPILGSVGALTAVELAELIEEARTMEPPDSDEVDE